ncbi:MAG TPA: sugar ABC transporter permease [Acidimicrobiales bacterium]|nr:sugar ABC transporter permease [Acidimicrobiales bacterium]
MAVSTSPGIAEELLEGATKRRQVRRLRPLRPNRDWLPALGLLGPNLALFTIFIVVPVLLAIAISFTNWDLSGVPQFVGLANYRRMIDDSQLWSSLRITAEFLLMGVVPTVLLGLLLALLVNIRIRFIAAIRTLYFIPAVVSFAASSVLWQWIYRPGQGVLDFLLYKAHIVGPAWLSDQATALPALAIVSIWLTLPTATILYLAALQRIPESVIEAALLDGAGPFKRLRYVIWPGVQTMTLLVAVYSILAFTNSSFDLVNILTQGGPLGATETLIWYIYYLTFSPPPQLGYASAISLFQLVLFVGLLAACRGVGRLVNR